MNQQNLTSTRPQPSQATHEGNRPEADPALIERGANVFEIPCTDPSGVAEALSRIRKMYPALKFSGSDLIHAESFRFPDKDGFVLVAPFENNSVAAGNHVDEGYIDRGQNIFEIPATSCSLVSKALASIRMGHPNVSFRASDVVQAETYYYGAANKGFVVIAKERE